MGPESHFDIDPWCAPSVIPTKTPRLRVFHSDELTSAADSYREFARSGVTAARDGCSTPLDRRLEAALKAGAEGVGCQAAAFYLLDDATTQLTMRAAWGPPERLATPPRPLHDALADLEAMLGHAVVLETPQVQEHFNAPECFSAAVCVPLSSPTAILGTLWVFSDSERDFTERQTNVIELAAGRITADLERETLVQSQAEIIQWKRELAAAQRLQRNQLPTIAPLLDGWDVAGWTSPAETIGGDFFDWFGLPDGLVGVALGDVMQRGIEAALAASTLRAALRSHGQYHRDVDAIMRQTNLTLWQGSAGDQFASAFCGLLETATGRIRYCHAGQPGMVLLRQGRWELLPSESPPLGESPETDYSVCERMLQPGDALAVFSTGCRDALVSDDLRADGGGLTELMASQADRHAQELVALARRRIESTSSLPAEDRTILVVKRTAP